MTDPETKPADFPWPPLIFVAAVALSILLNFFYKLPWIGPPVGDMLLALGWLLLVGSCGLTFSAIRALRGARTATSPTQPARHLVTTGAFALSRNPLYLANVVAIIGIGLISSIAWFVPMAILAGYLTQKSAIEGEEAHLEARFGKKYRDYRKRIRRWI